MYPAVDSYHTILRADGEIVTGDFNKFLAHLQANQPLAKVLLITSPGGSVNEAMQIAKAIKVLDFSVVVLDECASACAQIIFPAGKFSTLTPGSMLGIHSCSQAGERNNLCNEAIAQLAVRNGFPYGTLDMFADLYGPGSMKWMTEISARCFGFYHAPEDPKPINGNKACIDGFIYTMGATVDPRPFGPSFDCGKASTSVERLFCLDKELMQVDSILGLVYDTALLNLTGENKTKLTKEQKEWIMKRNKTCAPLIGSVLSFAMTRSGALCLYRYNEARIYDLINHL
jgi:uncharacterized protein YecT (DUF1311 family)